MKRLFVVTFCTLLLGACSSPDENENNTVTICTALTCADAGATEDSGSATGGDDTGTSADMGSPVVDAAPDEGTLPTLMATEANEADILYGWVAAGQPSETRVEEVVATGATIISLRLMSEDPFDEPGLIDSLGGTFIRYPTTGPDYDDPNFREAMYDLYDSELDAGNIVFLHCASSNRVGASWALYQAERKGVAAEEAITMGQAAGLSSLETRVREILAL